jgi:hypothetical protein
VPPPDGLVGKEAVPAPAAVVCFLESRAVEAMSFSATLPAIVSFNWIPKVPSRLSGPIAAARTAIASMPRAD